MITLVTGEPGNGKTAWVVLQLLEMIEASEKPRPIYTWGIEDLKLPGIKAAPAVEAWTAKVPNPSDPSRSRAEFQFPAGSVVVVDECQTVYRPRSSAAAVPPYVEALETHRHHGLDFFLVTQKPTLVDKNALALVGRHVHLKSNWNGRYYLEWSEAKNPGSRAECGMAVRKKYKLPQRVFELYKSATVHTRIERRVPKQLYIVYAGLALLVLGGLHLSWRIYSRIHGQAEQAAESEVESKADAGSAGSRVEPVGPPAMSASESSGGPWQRRGWRLVSWSHVSSGPRVVLRSFTVEASDGERRRLQGRDCLGEGRDAVCTVDGERVAMGFRSERATGSYGGQGYDATQTSPGPSLRGPGVLGGDTDNRPGLGRAAQRISDNNR